MSERRSSNGTFPLSISSRDTSRWNIPTADHDKSRRRGTWTDVPRRVRVCQGGN